MLKREDWYSLANKLDWTFAYVAEEDVFPSAMAGRTSIPRAVFAEEYDAPFKVSYREYVGNQREKDLKVMAVKEAVDRGNLFERLDPSYRILLQFHFGFAPFTEYGGALAEARMARFGRAAEWRNLAAFGCLDEIRHAQIQLLIPHGFVRKDPKYAWAHKFYWTEDWASVATRRFIDDCFVGSNAIEIPLMLNFAFEVGLSNLQFVAMAAQAFGSGDYEFGTMTQSIQTDEARHAQIGTPLVRILLKHGERDLAEYLIWKALWLSFRLVLVLTGTVMDYAIPLAHRRSSFKEFGREFVALQLDRILADLGIGRPWFWDQFLYELDYSHHAFQIGIYAMRQTLWFDSRGPNPDERAWLVEHYPHWEEKFGSSWDTVIENVRQGRLDRTLGPKTMALLCNTCQLPCSFPHPGKTTLLTAMHAGRKYVFCSEPCRWIFKQEVEKFAGQKTILDRLLCGDIQPATPEGIMKYMGMDHPEEMGKDVWDYSWAREYFPPNADAKKVAR